ncbi:DUF3106 domain-containing protein [Acinetobacter rathckeae]|uniref:DUF3106 domain-containing protein n=1 Tax=Acinetobacter rathckeae TaxID=2605272 RepID=UPI0018A32265|nr:DUF3106 domain-containing protein [Acinetobacter rathckeae]MBF7694912.1 DUF3106 domain-containing protein [Acinetobacter rathckeae]
MEVKKLTLAIISVAFLQTSFASLWPFSLHTTPSNAMNNDDNWNELSTSQQQVLLQHYQSLKDIPEKQRTDLQQKMEWFTQLSEEEQQRLRLAWQHMNTQQRKQLRKEIEQAKTKEERDQIRQQYIEKYTPATS